MFPEFEKYIHGVAKLSDEDMRLICSKASKKLLRRKQLLLQKGEVCRFKVFVSKGFLRTYGISEDGGEHITKFSPENTWTTEPESYDTSMPSRYNIGALEDSELLVWTKPDFNELLIQIPTLKSFSEQLISRNLYQSQQRIFSNLSATAEERYDDFVKNFPGVFARVPLHMVASYLGVSRETLSRIRHAQLKR